MVYKSPMPAVTVSDVPAHERLLGAIRQHVARNNEAVCFINGEITTKRVLYREIEPMVLNVATALRQMGFGPGSVAAQVLPNCSIYLVNILAVQKCGGAMSNANAIFTDYELQMQFADSECTVVFTDEDRLPKVKRAVEKSPKVEKIICLRTFPMKSAFPPNVVDYEDFRNAKGEEFSLTYAPDSIALIPYSSGTTGRPKGVLLTHKNIVAMLDMAVKYAETDLTKAVFGDAPAAFHDEHLLLFLPFYHAFGLNIMFEGVMLGATNLVFKKFDPVVTLNRIKFYKVKILYVVPPMLIFLAKDMMVPIFKVDQFIKVIMSAGAAAGQQICDEVKKRFPNAWLCQGYGMTEMVQFATIPRFEHGDNFTSVGSLAHCCELKLINKEGQEVTEEDKKGEICFRGPTVMKGYLKQPHATAEVVDQDGFMHTGDLGYIEKNGQVHVVGRLKELIKVNGMQVPPVEIEDVLLLHPHVKDAAVIGMPDEQSGEAPKAFIVKKDSGGLTAAEITSFVQQKLSSYKWLTGGVEFVDSIPKLPSGKICRRKLMKGEDGTTRSEKTDGEESGSDKETKGKEKKP